MSRTFDELKANGFKGAAQQIDDYDLPRIGHIIGVGEDVIHALIDVESSGSGFDSKGRPKMLFEPHVFYRNLPQGDRAIAIAKGLAYKEWKKGSYPKDSYPRLYQALAINETAALKAASWGMGQILGENFVAAGYDTPQDMVVAFCENEDAHLEAMIRFLIANRLDDELRVIDRLNRPSTPDDWRSVGRGYNGERYAEHNYHGRLAERHNWWRGKKDTPWSPDVPVPPVVPTPPVEPLPKPVEPIPQPPAPIPYPKREGPVWVSYVLLAQYFGDPEPSKEVPMVGGIVGGLVVSAAKGRVGKVLADIVIDAVQNAAKQDNPLDQQDAPIVAVDAASEAMKDPRMKEIIAYTEHATNNEPNRKSRVVVGGTTTWISAVVPIIIGVGKVFGWDLEDKYELIAYALSALGAAWGYGFMLYGRYKARKPIGE